MISIKKVTSDDDFKDFVKFPNRLYKDSKYWVSPIINEELEMMNKEKTQFLIMRKQSFLSLLKIIKLSEELLPLLIGLKLKNKRKIKLDSVGTMLLMIWKFPKSSLMKS